MVRFLIYFFSFFAFCIFDFTARGISAADDAKDVGPASQAASQPGSLLAKARQSCTLVITVMSLGYASDFQHQFWRPQSGRRGGRGWAWQMANGK